MGKPISTDKLTSTKGRPSYARVLFEVDTFLELVWSIKIRLPMGKSKDQLVSYEHEQKFYATCKVFGRKTLDCKLVKQATKGSNELTRKEK